MEIPVYIAGAFDKIIVENPENHNTLKVTPALNIVSIPCPIAQKPP
jgi:hypothetical protein